MIILRTPKGWTAPKELDGHKLEGYWRAHQIPIPDVAENPAHLKILEAWMRRYKPEELFDENGTLVPELKEMAPTGTRRMSANPHANGGLLRKPLRFRISGHTPRRLPSPGPSRSAANLHSGSISARRHARQYGQLPGLWAGRNRVQPPCKPFTTTTKKTWLAEFKPEDSDGGELSPDGRVMEMLSEHTLEGLGGGLRLDRPPHVLRFL